MKHVFPLLIIGAALAVPAAYADSATTTFSGTVGNQLFSEVSGRKTADTPTYATLGTFSGQYGSANPYADIVMDDGTGTTYDLTSFSQGFSSDFQESYVTFSDNAGDLLTLYIAPGLTDIGNDPFCADTSSPLSGCGGPSTFVSADGTYDLDVLTDQEQVTINPVAATPEPSGIALLGTGLLGVAGVVRKRFTA